jgi:hypothetical protein
LLWAAIIILVAIGLYASAPWILPVRIYEGPLVQMAAEDAVTLVWYTTRPARCSVTVGQSQTAQPAVADGNRNRVRISGLAPGTSYPYYISAGSRRLTNELAFQTNRAADQRYTFLVFGDSGCGSRAQYLLAGQMASEQPPADFLLHTGDLVYPDGGRQRYEERFFAPYRHLLARVSFWPCLGNHDLGDDGQAAAYREVFELPDNGPAGLPIGHNYWFDYASCRVAVIDSNLDQATLLGQVAPWLAEVMAAPEARWRFVSFHHPPYTGGKYQPDLTIQRALVPAMEEVGVDLVFNGHDHMYQRTHPLRGGQIVPPGEGIIYVISAAGGARIYEAADPRPDYIAVLDNQSFSFTQVTIAGDELTLRQIALDGHPIDEFTLRKSPAVADAEPAADATSP